MPWRAAITIILILQALLGPLPARANDPSCYSPIVQQGHELFNFYSFPVKDQMLRLRGNLAMKKAKFFDWMRKLRLMSDERADERILEYLQSAMDRGILDVEEAHAVILDVGRPELMWKARKLEGLLGNRARGLTSSGQSMYDLVEVLNKRVPMALASRTHLVQAFEVSDVSPDELALLVAHATPRNAKEVRELADYVHFLDSEPPKLRQKGIQDVVQLFDRGGIESPVVKKFHSIQMETDGYEARQLQKLKGSGMAEEEAERLAAQKAERFKKLRYACRSPKKNAVNADAAKVFIRSAIGMKVGMRAASYAYNRKDEEWGQDFWTGLSWEVMSNLLIGKLVARFSASNDPLLVKIIQNNALYAGAEMAMYDEKFGLYGMVMAGGKQVLISEETRKALADPTKKKDIQEFMYFIERQGILATMEKNFKFKAGSNPEQALLGAAKNYKDLKGMDNEYEALLKMVNETMVDVMMEEKLAEGEDIYDFNRYYGLFSAAEGLASSMAIMHLLCRATDLPLAQRYAMAMALTGVESHVMNRLYYGARDKHLQDQREKRRQERRKGGSPKK